VLAANSDWFIVLFVPAVIGESNYVGFWFYDSFKNRSKIMTILKMQHLRKESGSLTPSASVAVVGQIRFLRKRGIPIIVKKYRFLHLATILLINCQKCPWQHLEGSSFLGKFCCETSYMTLCLVTNTT